MKSGEWSRALQRWGETPSSPNFYPLEIRARRSLAPPGSRKRGQVSMKVKR